MYSASGTASVQVTLRPADLRADYLDPGKADVSADVPTVVTDVHGDAFVTVAPGPGATVEDLHAVADSLVWE